MDHSEFVNGLREAADFFEARPELGVPSCSSSFTFYGDINGKTIDSKEGLAEFVRIVGGHIDKTADDDFFRLRADRGSFSVRAVAYRNQVCERVQVGTKIEPGHVIPAQAETYVADREVPIYEYRCPSILSISREEEAQAEIENAPVEEVTAE